MFQGLSDRLNDVFKRLRGYGRLTEENVAEALREVRLALLEADVNVKVVRSFLERVRERSLGRDVLEGWHDLLDHFLAVRDRAVGVPFVDVLYDRLRRDPCGFGCGRDTGAVLAFFRRC
mgnify:CR=1 FL=1